MLMETARRLGLAARFVSGYIFVPDAYPGTGVGGGATPAWVQVYLPGAGRVDFDPTNSITGNRNLFRVAVAWDPSQPLPLWGGFTGPASAAIGMTEPPSGRNDLSGGRRPVDRTMLKMFAVDPSASDQK